MIPKALTTAWRGNAPWRTNALVVSRAIVELFSHRQVKAFFPQKAKCDTFPVTPSTHGRRANAVLDYKINEC